MRTVQQIERPMIKLMKRKRVAAYARVSVESDRMYHSLSAQISYYSKLIQKNPEWEYAGVYADYGISGTRIKKRQDFQRLLEDAEIGKFDIILTKSIQRFARNTVDLLQIVRHLKELNIEVWFEKENIHTMSGDGELMMTILASFAQEESRSISENIKWRFQKKFQQGIPHAKFFVYGYHWQDDELKIVPEEAKMVRKIFNDYLNGKSRKDIMRSLNDEGVRTMYGNSFKDASIKQILTNRIYTGVLEMQKTFVIDPITKRQIINHGEKNKYVVENHHEALITPILFERVQEELTRRREEGKKKGGYARDYLNISCFTGVIKCGICGKSYVHVVRKYKGKIHEYWTCDSHKGKGTNCGAYGSIPQPVLKKACTSVLGLSEFNENNFMQCVEKIVVPAYQTLVFHLSDGRIIEQKWESTARKDCWTDELKLRQKKWMEQYRQSKKSKRYHAFSGRIYCPTCNATFVRCLDWRKNGKVPYWRSRGEHKCNHVSGIREDRLENLVAVMFNTHSYDSDIFRQNVKRIEIQKNGDLLFWLTDGSSKGVKLK